MKRKGKIPKFRSDRKAADFWATHDAACYARDLKEEPVTVDTALRRRVIGRTAVKKAVALRLKNQQITRAKELARRKSSPSRRRAL